MSDHLLNKLSQIHSQYISITANQNNFPRQNNTSCDLTNSFIPDNVNCQKIPKDSFNQGNIHQLTHPFDYQSFYHHIWRPKVMAQRKQTRRTTPLGSKIIRIQKVGNRKYEIRADLLVPKINLQWTNHREFTIKISGYQILKNQRVFLYLPPTINQDTIFVKMPNAMFGRAELLEPQAKAFADQQNTIAISSDLPGHGESSRPEDYEYSEIFQQGATLHAWNDIIHHLSQTGHSSFRNFTLPHDQQIYSYGISYGAGVVQAEGILYPEESNYYVVNKFDRELMSTKLARKFPIKAKTLLTRRFDDTEKAMEYVDTTYTNKARQFLSQNNYQAIRLVVAQAHDGQTVSFVEMSLQEIVTDMRALNLAKKKTSFAKWFRNGRNGLGYGVGDKTVPPKRTKQEAKKFHCRVDKYGNKEYQPGHYVSWEFPEQVAANAAAIFRGEVDQCKDLLADQF